MDDFLLVAVHDGGEDLLHVADHELLGVVLHVLDALEKFAALAVLGDDVVVLDVAEDLEDLDDVGVVDGL